MISRVVRAASRGCAALATGLTLLLVVVITTDIARRNTTGQAVPGVVEIAEILLVMIVYLSLAYTQQQGSHIKITIGTRRLPERIRRVVVAAGLLVTTLFMFWIVRETSVSALDSFQRGEYRFGLLRVPMWPARAAIAVGFLLLASENVLTIVDGALGRRDRAGVAPATDVG